MDIIQQLPFPDEICNKIFLYGVKSPHTDLECGILKYIFSPFIYKKLRTKKGIDVDKYGHVTRVDILSLFYSERQKVQFNIQWFHSFPYLIQLNLSSSNVKGDVKVLQSMPYLYHVRLYNTQVFGKLLDLKTLPNISGLDIENIGIRGDKKEFTEYRKIHGLTECQVFGT